MPDSASDGTEDSSTSLPVSIALQNALYKNVNWLIQESTEINPN